MRKVTAIVLAVMMVLTLFACGTSGSGASPAPGSTAPAATSAAPASPSPSAQPSAAPSASPSPSEKSAVGMYSDKVDWFARKPYKIIYMSISLQDPLHGTLNKAFEDWSKLLNVEYSSFDGNSDYGNFMVQVETYATRDYDGFIFDIDQQGQSRIMDLCTEYKLNWMPALTAFTDTDNRLTHPAVLLRSYDTGKAQAKWLFENYKTYLANVDPKDVGVMTVEWSGQPDIHARSVGAADWYKEQYPDLFKTNYFNVDLLNAGFTADAAYSNVSAKLSGNADIKYWVIAGSNDDFAAGAARAVESLIPNKAIVCSVMGDLVIKDWATGYKGALVCCVTTSLAVFAEPVICGLIAMLDGRTTPETLWSDSVPQGEKYGVVNLGIGLYTADNYKDYKGTVAEYVAAQYPDLKQVG
jgi:ABC-type sugar transport system substrate-binding protein